MGRSPKEVMKNERMGEIAFKQNTSKIVLFVYFITL